MLWFARPALMSMIAGVCIIALGEFLRLWGVAIAGSETRTTGPVGGTFLITTGPFSYVRNPLYLGNMLLYFGVGIMANLPFFALGALAYFLFQYSLIVSLEEEYLHKTFGEDFKQYCAAVPRFFPAMRKYADGKNIQPELQWRRGMRSEKRTLQAILVVSILLGVLMFVRG